LRDRPLGADRSAVATVPVLIAGIVITSRARRKAQGQEKAPVAPILQVLVCRNMQRQAPRQRLVPEQPRMAKLFAIMIFLADIIETQRTEPAGVEPGLRIVAGPRRRGIAGGDIGIALAGAQGFEE